MSEKGSLRFEKTEHGTKRVIVDGVDSGEIWRRGSGWRARKPNGATLVTPQRYRDDAVYWLLNS